ncbi:MAG: hypothetical protein V3U75_11685 [Methylococcaceae bacterium]
MKKNRLMYFILSVIFTLGFCCQAMALTPGPLWLGTKSLPAKFLVEVAKGHVPGHSIVHKFGKATVGTTLVPITNSLVYQMPTAAVALEFVSSDANDTAAGTGAQEITIQGLNSDWEIFTQVIATNGATPVPLPTDMTRLFRWFVSGSGTYATATANSHAGTLTIRVASAGATWSTIGILPRPIGQSQIACYTIPEGFRAFVYTHEIRVDSTKSADILMFVRNSADTIAAPFPAMRLAANFIGVSGIAQSDTNAPRNGFASPADIIFMGKISSGTAEVVIDFEVLLIEDGY